MGVLYYRSRRYGGMGVLYYRSHRYGGMEYGGMGYGTVSRLQRKNSH